MNTNQELQKPTGAGYAVVFAAIVAGAIASVALASGKTNWLWLGCGVGAGLGMMVAQAMGVWPKKK